MIRQYIYTLFIIVAASAGAAAVVSCDNKTVFHSYHHTIITGWEKNDTLSYSIPPLKEPGRYRESVGLRINSAYPFTSITLVIKQDIFPGKRSKTDTIKCQFSDERGYRTSNGVSCYQYDVPLIDIDLRRGDSIQISIQHAMKREMLPGISDVGFKLFE